MRVCVQIPARVGRDVSAQDVSQQGRAVTPRYLTCVSLCSVQISARVGRDVSAQDASQQRHAVLVLLLLLPDERAQRLLS